MSSAQQHNAFIGFGTGRCGTKSLARIINACRNTQVTHEYPDWRTSWYDADRSRIDAMIKYFREREYSSIIGDVGFYWPPHLEYVKSRLPDIKFVWMRRSKEETVESFVYGQNKVGGDQAVYGPLRPTINGQKASRAWNQMYPMIDAYDLKQSIEFYWEMYDRWAQTVDCYQIDVYDLNKPQKVNELFDYLQIPEEDRIYSENVHFNKRK